MFIKGYYFITDSILSRKGNFSDVKAALRAGVSVVQYRNKCSNTKEMYEEALILRKLCNKILFFINDRVDVALAVKADGVHIGQCDMPYRVARKMLGKNKIIGVTVHNLKEALIAQVSGADYLGVAPIFITTTKKDAGNPKGIALLRSIRKKIVIPLVAIGGINLENAQRVVKTGAEALCAISAVVTKKDVKREIEKFQSFFIDSKHI